MGEKLVWAQLILTLICGGVGLYTASVVGALKVWILEQQAAARKENDQRYVSRYECEMCQARTHGHAAAAQGD